MNKYPNASKLFFLVLGLILLNIISNTTYFRIDLTEDQRYTLSEPAKAVLEQIEEDIIIKVYLKGEFPTEFKRLQTETKQILEELKSENKKIKFRFINPLDVDTQSLIKNGLEPSQLSMQQNGKVSEIIIFPWATVENKNKIEIVSLLKDTNSQSQEEQLQNSIENLEYAFTEAIHKVISKKQHKIAILKGIGEPKDIYAYDFLKTIGKYYFLAPFTLDSVETNPTETLEELKAYDLIVVNKPTEKFTEKEKYTLDQYILNGGKSLWMIDNVTAEMDSLMKTGETLAFPKDLNITDLLFSYGVRINMNLVEDLYAATIPLASGKVGNQTQFNQFLWKYFPLVTSNNNHPINKHIDPVRFKFTSNIDLLKNNTNKTVLLASSPLSKTIGVPTIIDLNSIAKPADPKTFNKGRQTLAVLLEGDFKSAYSDRIKPFAYKNNKDKSTKAKMVIISDGDFALNGVSKGIPDKLGFDKWTGQQFGNKEFLLNAVNYLLDDSGLIQIRSKNIEINFLDKEKAYKEQTFYRIINVLLPVIILSLFMLIFNFIRKRKYS